MEISADQCSAFWEESRIGQDAGQAAFITCIRGIEQEPTEETERWGTLISADLHEFNKDTSVRLWPRGCSQKVNELSERELKIESKDNLPPNS